MTGFLSDRDLARTERAVLYVENQMKDLGTTEPRRRRVWPNTSSETSPTKIVEGYLADALAPNGGALLNVWHETADGFVDADRQVAVQDRGGFAASAGAYCVAVKVATIGSVEIYRPLVLGCA